MCDLDNNVYVRISDNPTRSEKLRGGYFWMCVGFLSTLEQFLSLTARSPSEHSLQRQNLSLYVYLAQALLIIPAFQAVLLYVSRFPARTRWDAQAGAADTADVVARFGNRMCVSD